MPMHEGNWGDFATLGAPRRAAAPYAKAIVGALIAGLGSLYQAADATGISTQEWIATAIATLTALGVVWGVPNADPEGKHQDESVQPPEGGVGEVKQIAIVACGTLLGLVAYFALLPALLGALR